MWHRSCSSHLNSRHPNQSRLQQHKGFCVHPVAWHLQSSIRIKKLLASFLLFTLYNYYLLKATVWIQCPSLSDSQIAF